jgi:D-glycero-D-manno-heptose 1,7-bisphosphate phosphatase
MRRALFLDRDGVINVDKGYVHRIADFEFTAGAFDLCKTAQDVGLVPIVITNQAGIGRGFYTEGDFQRLTAWMLEQFHARGIRMGQVYHCPYHPTAGIGDYRRESYDRKPNPGMILRARDELDLDLSHSVLVGDKDSDIEAGVTAGVRYNVKLVQQSDVGSSPDSLEFHTLRAVSVWLRRTFGSRAPG